MAFHRLATPTYFGGLPSGYDYINNPSANGDAGVPAFADNKKASGVNAGSYWVTFGEDGTSNDVNRGFKALSENTDTLDNLMRRDLALTARTADVTAGSAVNSVVIAGQVFVGTSGVSNTQDQRDQLISVLDSNDNELLVGSTKIQASLIHDGSSVNVVGTQTSGFFSSPTVNFNVAIPSGTTYRLYYGFRGNLATLPQDAFTNIKIRGAQEIEAGVEQLFRDLHSTASGTNWNDPWVATINSLARTGLDGRYRLSTADPGASPALNTPGNGGTVTRDGVAMAVAYPTYDLSSFPIVGVNRYPDALLAAWRLKRVTNTIGTAFDTRFGGDYGMVQESPYHNLSDANEVAYNHVTNAIVLDVIPRNITASTLSTHAVASRINSAGSGLVNPGAGSDATSRRTLQTASGDFIRATGTGHIGVRATDLIEVTDAASGLVVGTFRLDTVLTDTTFTVKTVTGALPSLGPSGSSAAVKLRWLQPVVSIGGQHRSGAGGAHGIPSLYVAQPGVLTDSPDSESIEIAAIWLSALAVRGVSTNEKLYTAGSWGGFDQFGVPAYNGSLLGDGGITTLGGRQSMNQMSRRAKLYVMPNGGTPSIAHDPVANGNAITICPAAAVTVGTATTFALSTANGYVVQDGDELDITVVVRAGTTGAVTFTWPGNFVFSAGDGVVPPTNAEGVDYVVQLRFNYKANVPTPGWYATRTDY